MYRMYVIYTFGLMSNEVEYKGVDRDACIAQINSTLEINPALEYTIAEEGPVA